MIKNFRLPFLSLVLLITFSSCTRNLFLPSAVYSPQLFYKHEGEIGINGNGNSGVQVQGAFALTNSVGIQAQANAVSRNSGDFLAGPNYWLTFRPDSQNTFLVEFSAGYACGTYTKYITRETGSATTGMAAQPGYILYEIGRASC